jgi:hypothetical protein
MTDIADKSVVAYPEALGELGVLVRRIQDLVAPYNGHTFLVKVLEWERNNDVKDADGCRSLSDITVRVVVSYDPQKLHQDILQSCQPSKDTV